MASNFFQVLLNRKSCWNAANNYSIPFIKTGIWQNCCKTWSFGADQISFDEDNYIFIFTSSLVKMRKSENKLIEVQIMRLMVFGGKTIEWKTAMVRWHWVRLLFCFIFTFTPCRSLTGEGICMGSNGFVFLSFFLYFGLIHNGNSQVNDFYI